MESLKRIKHLGEGAFGKVELYEDIKNGKQYAVKFISNGKNIDKEVNILRAMSNECPKYVPKLYDRISTVIDGKKQDILIMEYINGYDLYTYLMDIKPKITSEFIILFMNQLFSAIYCIHRNKIVHRDIKLENIMINVDGYMKLIDFGLSCQYSDYGCLTKKVGTPIYLPPEYIKYIIESKTTKLKEDSDLRKTLEIDWEQFNDGNFDKLKKADIWSAGLVMYAMIFKSFPFDIEVKKEDKERELNILYSNIENKKFLSDLKNIKDLKLRKLYMLIIQCLNKNPTNRPDASQILIELHEEFPGIFKSS